jgi:hypothetical protein
MKQRISLLIAVTLAYASAFAQPPTGQNQGQPQQQTNGQEDQANADPYDLKNDPDFQRLSPAQQDWVRSMTNRLHSAFEQKDLRALDQLKLEAAQKQLIGTKFCGEHIFSQAMYLDALALSDSRKEEAFVARWLEPEHGSGEVHSAVFTAMRCVASDGDTLDGRRISRILPNSLAIGNQNGLVAYEALYFDHQAQSPVQTPDIRRGIFIENRFLIDLDARKASALLNPRDEDRDFWWSPGKERIQMRFGVVVGVPPRAEQK